MSLSKSLGSKGDALIKDFESLKLTGYLPTPNDVPTIGWGSTNIFGRKPIIGETITIEQAQVQFDLEIAEKANAVNDAVKVPLTQNQFDALVSFAYNVGIGALRSSTLLKLLNQSKYAEAADQFLRWDKQAGKVLKGLTRRRIAERELFLEK